MQINVSLQLPFSFMKPPHGLHLELANCTGQSSKVVLRKIIIIILRSEICDKNVILSFSDFYF